MPPHAGHQVLVDTALGLVDALTILVCVRPHDPIPGSLRQQWLEALFPSARVIAIAADPHLRNAGAEWQAMVAHAHPEPVDLLFTAERGDVAWGEAIGAEVVLLDPERATVPVSAALIRADPIAHWASLPDVVRPFYTRTICLHGPESTGKSTLAPRLARHFVTIFVPEHGRTYCEQHGLDLTMADLVAIGRTHAALIQAARRRCTGRLILDTDPLMTSTWADMLFGRRDPWFDTFEDTADLYLLLDIDVPWADDGTRFFGDATRRQRFFDLSRAELDRRGLRYAIVRGSPDERLARSLEAIAAAGL